jgi:hypothetical protein
MTWSGALVRPRAGPPGTARLEHAAAQAAAHASTASPADPPARSREVQPAAGAVRLAGYLTVPDNPRGIVVFAHGSGSSRHSPRNRHVAGILNDAGLGTLLVDLLTPEEELNRANVFDIGLLAGRLAEVTGWLRDLHARRLAGHGLGRARWQANRYRRLSDISTCWRVSKSSTHLPVPSTTDSSGLSAR